MSMRRSSGCGPARSDSGRCWRSERGIILRLLRERCGAPVAPVHRRHRPPSRPGRCGDGLFRRVRTMSSTIEKSVEVDVPVRVAYNQWTQFEEFPHFMQGIKEVRQVNDKKTHWVAEVGFKEKEWDADIVEQTPDTRIAWRNTTGAANVGIVDFLPIGEGRTKVTA